MQVLFVITKLALSHGETTSCPFLFTYRTARWVGEAVAFLLLPF